MHRLAVSVVLLSHSLRLRFDYIPEMHGYDHKTNGTTVRIFHTILCVNAPKFSRDVHQKIGQLKRYVRQCCVSVLLALTRIAGLWTMMAERCFSVDT